MNNSKARRRATMMLDVADEQLKLAHEELETIENLDMRLDDAFRLIIRAHEYVEKARAQLA
jgi:hypothetical protein